MSTLKLAVKMHLLCIATGEKPIVWIPIINLGHMIRYSEVITGCIHGIAVVNAMQSHI